MSRIGKKPVAFPREVKVIVSGGRLLIEGPKGKLEQAIPPGFTVTAKDGSLLVARPSDTKRDKSLHGMLRSVANNMIIGVTKGYVKELEISGVGFKAQVQGKSLSLVLSYTHPIDYPVPEGITIETPKPTNIIVRGVDKVKVGQVAADIRGYYEPEPYKGKGIRYAGEVIKRKAGKAVAGAAGGAG